MENSYGKSYVGIFTLLAILTVLLSMSCMATLFTTRTMLMAVNFMSVVYFLVRWNKLLDFKGSPAKACGCDILKLVSLRSS